MLDRRNRPVSSMYGDRVAGEVDLDELTAQALAADPTVPIDSDAVPFGTELSAGADLLPEWYMPRPQLSASERTPRRVFTVGLIVVAMLLLNGVGLCVTYGLPEIAW